MRKVELQILAKDIKNTCYVDSDDCAITRALRRAGLTDYVDVGVYIAQKKNSNERISVDYSEYRALNNKVQSMYGFGENHTKPTDFTHTLTFLDLEGEE